MKMRLLVCAVSSLLAVQAFAAEKKSAHNYRPHWGMAGCGLGSVVVNDLDNYNSKLYQIIAWWVNDLIVPQTSAISTGTSNCNVDQSQGAIEREVYVSTNFSSLDKEAAQGNGEHLDALADVLGCTDDVALPAFKKLSQERHSEIFGSRDPKSVLENYLKEVKSDKELSQRCERLG